MHYVFIADSKISSLLPDSKSVCGGKSAPLDGVYLCICTHTHIYEYKACEGFNPQKESKHEYFSVKQLCPSPKSPCIRD